MRRKRKGYGFWMLMTIIFTLAAVSTLIPDASAVKECFLGYRAHCSWTPWSTLILLVLAGMVCARRRRKHTEIHSSVSVAPSSSDTEAGAEGRSEQD